MEKQKVDNFDTFFKTIDIPEELTAFDIENKWNEQNERCYWTGLVLQLDFFQHNVLNHPICPAVDKIDYSKPYSYDNIVICVKMAKDARNQTGFADFHQCMAMMANAILTKQTSPPYIMQILANREQAAATQRAMEEQKQDKDRVNREILELNPKLKQYIENKEKEAIQKSKELADMDVVESDSLVASRPGI